jgi:hypothetical protein
MSNWVCQGCGTINKDPFDVALHNPTSLQMEFYTDLYKQKRELEKKGEQWHYECERCGEDRQ